MSDCLQCLNLLDLDRISILSTCEQIITSYDFLEAR